MKTVILIFYIILFYLFAFSDLKALQPPIWSEEFEGGMEHWKGSLNEFILSDSRAISNSKEAKARLWLLRDIWSDNEFRYRKEEGWQHAKDSGLCWEGVFETGFNPSSTNYFRFYLWISNVAEAKIWDKEMAESQDTIGMGYYLQLGEKGSKNRWSLYYQNGVHKTLIWAGNTIYNKASGGRFELRVKINSEGYMQIEEKGEKDTLWRVQEDSVFLGWDTFLPDTCITQNLYTAYSIYYQTASRAELYSVDAIRISGIRPDANLEDDTGEEGEGDDDGDDEGGEDDDGDGYEAKPWALMPNSTSWLWSEVLFEVGEGKSKHIEIYNADTMALSPYFLYVGVKGEKSVKWSRLCKDTNLLVGKGDYVCWCKDIGSLNSDYNICFDNLVQAEIFPSLPADNGELLLAWMGTDDTVYLESMSYSKKMHHILLKTTKDVSLERIGFRRSAMDVDNWQSASLQNGGSSPGCINTQYNGDLDEEEKQMGAYFSFSSRLITPNADGLNDYVEISWNSALEGYVAKADVYDSRGRKILTLADEVILSSRGCWVFKGVDNKGVVLRSGVYMWLIRIVHPGGKHKLLRYAFAVG